MYPTTYFSLCLEESIDFFFFFLSQENLTFYFLNTVKEEVEMFPDDGGP